MKKLSTKEHIACAIIAITLAIIAAVLTMGSSTKAGPTATLYQLRGTLQDVGSNPTYTLHTDGSVKVDIVRFPDSFIVNPVINGDMAMIPKHQWPADWNNDKGVRGHFAYLDTINLWKGHCYIAKPGATEIELWSIQRDGFGDWTKESPLPVGESFLIFEESPHKGGFVSLGDKKPLANSKDDREYFVLRSDLTWVNRPRD